MKKLLSFILIAIITAALTGCNGNSGRDTITVLSREEGSGTRDAFEDLLEIEETTLSAEISDSTAVMITTVKGNKNAIGYISLGSLGDDVTALKVDGIEANTENVKNGSYKVSRPFNIATKENISDIAKDFLDFILSEQGQAVVEDNKYISSTSQGEYTASGKSGKITVAGSSSVTPVMEKLKEAYIKLNPEVTIDIQQSDSSNGIQSTISGICDIGMASRELKESETDKGLVSTVIALDGIAVIVNKENPVTEISAEQIADIYTGEITHWSEIN